MFSIRRLILTKSNLLTSFNKKISSIKYFGAKVKGGDHEVDKTKKSTGSGTASESEKRPTTTEQTYKVNKTETSSKPTEQTHKENKTEEPSKPTVKIIQSIPGNQAPVKQDTIGGRYAQTLFSAASQEKNLYNVYEDMNYIISLYEKIPAMRIFCDNSGLNSNQINSFVQEMGKAGEFCETTFKFTDLLGKNKRFMFIYEIAKKYVWIYSLLSKEEKITIVSSQDLTDKEKADVKNAIELNPENSGKIFIIEYKVNPTILGGLQMYTENKFMDLSLNSRIEKIKDEVSKLV